MMFIELIPERIIVGCVVVLITYLQLTTNFYILGPAFGGWTSLHTQKILAPMNLFLISLYVNYYFACTIKPGYTPEGWEPPHAIIESIDDDLLKSGITGLRYCKTCEHYKPPRAHHCRHCGQCVLRMDHHCPWIGNCVGFANYSYFVRFVFSVMICCSYGCFLLLWRLQRIFEARQNPWIIHPSMLELVIVVFNIILIFFVLLLVGVLAVYHVYCLLKGQTTIEGSERTKTTQLIRRQKIDAVEFPFDIGYYQNICSVLGSNPIFWMWPQGTPGNGLQYAVKPNTDPRVVYGWPPRDPKELDPYSQTEETTTKLVRRDSEGYLVREITMEDRMHMLHHHLEDQGFIEAYSDDEEFDKKNK
ncbi:DHHC palmitoyltransferase-domain-containing protein [Gilbertella persicaria]|uniref:DHHC palmitoyltransferase-domain-containing protein n=1 Tax=Gilbertella persicaria TaxID=101096 RepID=UPI00221EFD74|nr:DHHC palmitoyltransferase-domain-containing protein [Gilbertella persicaria]KAI8098373.1 DHHC palmitoyltransferase-domain-containing protein [Gilbertella persicaria]